jgi:hypothetical protein
MDEKEIINDRDKVVGLEINIEVNEQHNEQEQQHKEQEQQHNEELHPVELIQTEKDSQDVVIEMHTLQARSIFQPKYETSSSSNISVINIHHFDTNYQLNNSLDYIEKLPIKIDNDVYFMYKTCFLTQINSKNKCIKYGTPIVTNSIFLATASCIFYYPEYYVNHPIPWTIHLYLIFFCYNYLYYLMRKWDVHKIEQKYNILHSHRIISLLCYSIFIAYYFYYSVIVFYIHREKSVNYQIINVVMMSGWYLFFNICASSYYFITTKLQQNAIVLYEWLKYLKNTKPDLDNFYDQYNTHYKNIRFFSKYWNKVILIGFLMLTFNLPLDYISVFYNHFYYSLPGAFIKSILLFWYIYCICCYNFYDAYIISYLYKHRIYEPDTIDKIQKYMIHRPITLDFYGFIINGKLLTKIIIIVLNLLIPTIYGIVSNGIFIK